MSIFKRNKEYEDIPELPPLPETEIVPPGIITSHEELINGVSDDDVEIIRDWNEENKL